MSSKTDISSAKADAEAARQALTAHWAAFFDEEGQFEATFGDPKKTPFAVRIWIGYDDAGETKVDIVYPAIEDSPFPETQGPTDEELDTLEGICYESTEHLDKDVSLFGQAIYNYLSGLDAHPSFSDPLREKWLELKKLAITLEQNRKHELTIEAKSLPTKFRSFNYQQDKKQHQTKVLAWWEQRAAWAKEMKRAREELARQRTTYADAQLQERLAPLRHHWYGGSNPRFVRHPEDEFQCYLEVVASMEQLFVSYAKQQITSVPAVFKMLKHVQEVNLSENKLTSVPEVLFELPQLKKLFLHQNEIRTIPSAIGMCANLEVLDLHKNQIAILPADIGALSNLQSLDLEKNKLKAIPESIADLSAKLSYLNLAHNSIKIIPTVLSALTNLAYFNLRNNPIVNLPPHIYLQGTAASMKYLREVSFENSEAFAPSSLRSDFGALLANKGWLCDLILRSKTPEDSSQPPAVSIPVHRSIVAARSPTVCMLLSNLHSRKDVQLEKDSTTNLPILPLDLSEEQLRILVAYLYEDRYTKPVLDLVKIELNMTEEQVVEAVKQNQILTAAHRAAVDRAYATADQFKVPHLTHLIDVEAKIPTPERQESPFLQQIKVLWCGTTGAPSATPVPESSFASAATSSAPTGPAAGVYPFDYDISFSFPANPEAPIIHAHKAILCARSKFLSSMLTGGLLESTQRVVEMKEIDPSVFAQMIEFCYSDDVEELNGETILDLLMAARLYGLDRLLGIVESVVGYSLDLNNVSGILMTASMYQLKKLGRACKFFVLSNWEPVTKGEAWSELPEAVRAKLTATAVSWGVIGGEE